MENTLKLFWTLLCVASPCLAAPTPNHPNNPAPASLRSTLDNGLISYMVAGKIPGMATVVVRNGQVKWMQTYGVLDRSKPETLAENKVGINTPFRVASVSKPVTAALILRMAEAAYFPHEYVDQYLPSDFPVVNPAFPGSRITLAQLLLHTSSIADSRAPYFPPSNLSDSTVASIAADALAGTLEYTDPRIIGWIGAAGSGGNVGTGDLAYFYIGASPSDGPLSLEQYLRRTLVPGGADHPIPSFSPNRSYFAFQPGTVYGYSNVNTTLLGHLAERAAAAAGQVLTFPQLAESVVFQPLAMTRSSFSLNATSPALLAATAVPHGVTGASGLQVNQKAMVNLLCSKLGCIPRYPSSEVTSTDYQPLPQYGVAERPAKGLRTSIQDLGRFVAMLAAGGSVNGSPFLASSTVDLMTSDQLFRYTDAEGEHVVGLGLFKFVLAPAVVANDDVWGHNGADGGVAACMLFSKSTGYGMAVIMNAPDELGGFSCTVLRDIYAYAYANNL